MSSYPVAYRKGANSYRPTGAGLSNASARIYRLPANDITSARVQPVLLLENQVKRIGSTVPLTRKWSAQAIRYEAIRLPWRRHLQNAVPLLRYAEAINNLMALTNSNRPGGGNFPGYKRYAGPFSYPKYTNIPTWLDPYTDGPTPLSGQYISHAFGMTLPLPLPSAFSTWSVSIDNPIFHGRVASYTRIAGSPGARLMLQPNLMLEAFAPEAFGDPKVDNQVTVNPLPTPYWAIPYRVQSPNRASAESTSRGPVKAEAVVASSLEVENIGAIVSYRPTTGLEVETIKNPVRKPPSRGEKERKTISNLSQTSLIARLVNAVTESLDVVDAIWEAIPARKRPGMVITKRGKEVRKWNPPPQYKLVHIYRHMDHVDWAQAAQNVLVNELEDRLYGGINRAITGRAQPWYQKFQRPVGFQTGPAL